MGGARRHKETASHAKAHKHTYHVDPTTPGLDVSGIHVLRAPGSRALWEHLSVARTINHQMDSISKFRNGLTEEAMSTLDLEAIICSVQSLLAVFDASFATAGDVSQTPALQRPLMSTVNVLRSSVVVGARADEAIMAWAAGHMGRLCGLLELPSGASALTGTDLARLLWMLDDTPLRQALLPTGSAGPFFPRIFRILDAYTRHHVDHLYAVLQHNDGSGTKAGAASVGGTGSTSLVALLNTSSAVSLAAKAVPFALPLIEVAAAVGTPGTTMRAHAASLAASFLRVVAAPGGLVPKDPVTQAAMAASHLLRALFVGADSAADEGASMDAYFSHVCAALVGPPVGAVPAQGDVPSISHEWFSRLGQLPQLALLRCLALVTPEAVLARVLPAPTAAPGQLAPPARTLLTHAILPLLLAGCRVPETGVRTYAVQALESWLSVAQRTHRFLAAAPPATRAQCALPVGGETLTSIVTLVLGSWAAAGRRISGVMPSLFDRVIDLMRDTEGEQTQGEGAATHATGAASPIGGALAPLLAQLVAQPPSYTAKYPAMGRLMARTGARPLLAVHPGLVTELYAAMCGAVPGPTADPMAREAAAANPAFAPMPAELHRDLMGALRQEMEAERGLPRGYPGGGNNVWRRGEDAGSSGGAEGPSKKKQKQGNSGRKAAAAAADAVSEPPAPATTLSQRLSSAGFGLLLEADSSRVGCDEAGVAALAAGVPSPDASLRWRVAVCLTAPDGTPGLAADTVAAVAALVDEAVSAGLLRPGDAPAAARELLHADVASRWRACWMGTLVPLLLHPSRAVRARAQAHPLTDLVRIDTATAAEVARALRAAQSSPALAQSGDGDDGYSPRERAIWALLQVARLAHACNDVPALPSPSAPSSTACVLSLSEVEAALLMPDPDLRLCAGELLATGPGGATTVLPGHHEYRLACAFVDGSLKAGSHSEFRKRANRVVVGLLKRADGSIRTAARAVTHGMQPPAVADLLARLGAALETDVAGDGTEIPLDAPASAAPSDSAPSEASLALALRQAAAFLRRVLGASVLPCLYPGAPSERLGLALELLATITSTARIAAPSSGKAGLGDALRGMTIDGLGLGALSAAVVTPLLCTGETVARLVNLLPSAWERVRATAAGILRSYPSGAGLPGFDSPAAASRLLQWGLVLTQSTRAKEAEAGALVLQVIYRLYVSGEGGQRWRVRLDASPAVVEAAGELASLPADHPHRSPSGRGKAFLLQLLALLRARTGGFSRAVAAVFGAGGAPSGSLEDATSCELPHGLIAALRLILCGGQEVDLVAAGKEDGAVGADGAQLPADDASDGASWRSLVATALRDVQGCLGAALHVVAGTDERDNIRGSAPAAETPATSSQTTGADGTADPEADPEAEARLLLPRGRVDCMDSSAIGGAGSMGTVAHTPSARGPALMSPHHTRGTAGVAAVTADPHVAGRALSAAGAAAAAALGSRPSDGGGRTADSTLGLPARSAQAPADEDDDEDGDDLAGPAAEGGEGGDDDGLPSSSPDDPSYVLVVGAWFVTREACLLQGQLIAKAPLPTLPEGVPSPAPEAPTPDAPDAIGSGWLPPDAARDPWIVSSLDTARVGTSLLSSLLALKHVGCIHNAAAGLGDVASRLLLHGGRHGPLARLPHAWLAHLLARLEGGGAHFILRRSAGFARAFVTLFESEPGNLPPVLLRTACRRLLALAGADLRGLDRDMRSLTLASAAGDEEEEEGDDAAGDEGGEDDGVDQVAGAGSAPSGDASSPRARVPLRVRVHACNVLRLVFKDSALALDAAPYVPTALITAVSGLSSRSWAVRNSSMMLFAAALERAIGSGSKNAHGPGLGSDVAPPTAAASAGRSVSTSEAGTGMSSSQFFAKHPSLLPFVIGQLNLCTQALARASSDAPSGAPAVPNLPSLYPVLLLLSRLRPDTASSGSVRPHVPGGSVGSSGGGSASINAVLLPLVRPCGTAPHAFIRGMAARAMAGLTSPSEAAAHAGVIMAGLAPVAASGACAPGSAQSSNTLHGELLQLRALLSRLTEPDAARIDVAASLRGPAAAVAGRLAELTDSATCPIGVVRAAAQECLSLCDSLRLVSAAPLALSLSVAVRALSLPPPFATAGSGSPQPPVGDALHAASAARAVAAWCVRGLFSAEAPPPTTRAATLVTLRSLLLSHPSDEARVAGAKQVKSMLKHADSLLPPAGDGGVEATLAALTATPLPDGSLGAGWGPTVGARLVELLCACLRRECGDGGHPDAARYHGHSLSLLLRFGRDAGGAPLAASLCDSPAAWATVLLGHDRVRDSNARAHLLTAAGQLARCVLQRGDAGAGVSPAVAQWCERAVAGCRAVRSFPLRFAAIRSIASSGILAVSLPQASSGGSTGSSSLAVPSWLATLTLLWDIDDEVRDAARTAVCSAAEQLASRCTTAPVPAAAEVLSALRSTPVTIPHLPRPVPLDTVVHAVLGSGLAGSAGPSLLLGDQAALDVAVVTLVAFGSLGPVSPADAILTALLEPGVQAAAAALAAPSAPDASESLPAPSVMLRRTLFLADPENDFHEPLETAPLLAAGLRAVAHVRAGTGEAPSGVAPPAAALPHSPVVQDEAPPFSASGIITDAAAWVGGSACDPERVVAAAVLRASACL